MSGRRGAAARLRIVLFLALLPLAFSACTELLHEPPPPGPATVAVGYVLDPDRTAESVAAAFGQTDQVLIRLARQATGALILERIFPVEQGSGEIRIELEVEMEAAAELFELFVELRRGQDPLFRGEALLELRAGSSSPADVELEPVPAGIALPSPPPPLTFLGETLQLQGQVLFVTGDPIPGLSLEWQALDPQIARITPAGLVTAVAEGDARMEGRFGSFSGTVTVQVRPEPASVEVEPAAASLLVGGTLQLTATVRDAGGSPMERPVAWSSSNPSVATVNPQGLVTGQSGGTAVIRAQVGDILGEATVQVQVVLPTAETLGAFDVLSSTATLAGQVNPNGSPTQAWFEWSTTPDLSDARSTPTQNLSGSSPQEVQAQLSGLQPQTTHYFRVVAENAAGRVQGQVMSFTTLEFIPPPENFFATQDGDIYMWWDYPREELPGTVFEVERLPHATGVWSLLLTTSDLQAVDPEENLSPGATYSYRVRACRTTHCSDYSNIQTVTTWEGEAVPGVMRP